MINPTLWWTGDLFRVKSAVAQSAGIGSHTPATPSMDWAEDEWMIIPVIKNISTLCVDT